MPRARLWTLRFGFYIERERYVHESVHTIDPITRMPSEIVREPYPLPPPTPPPPLPPTPDDETKVTWPVRAEVGEDK